MVGIRAEPVAVLRHRGACLLRRTLLSCATRTAGPRTYIVHATATIPLVSADTLPSAEIAASVNANSFQVPIQRKHQLRRRITSTGRHEAGEDRITTCIIAAATRSATTISQDGDQKAVGFWRAPAFEHFAQVA